MGSLCEWPIQAVFPSAAFTFLLPIPNVQSGDMLACLLAGRYAAYWLCYEDTDTSCRVVDCLTVLHVNVSVTHFSNGKELHTRSYNRHVQSVNMSILMGNKCLCESHIFPMNCNAELCVLHILIWLIPCFGFSFCRMVGLVGDTAVCLSKTCS